MNDGDCPDHVAGRHGCVGTSIRGTRSWLATPLVRVIHRFQIGMAGTHHCPRCDSPTERLAGLGAPV